MMMMMMMQQRTGLSLMDSFLSLSMCLVDCFCPSFYRSPVGREKLTPTAASSTWNLTLQRVALSRLLLGSKERSGGSASGPGSTQEPYHLSPLCTVHPQYTHIYTFTGTRTFITLVFSGPIAPRVDYCQQYCIALGYPNQYKAVWLAGEQAEAG